MNQQATLKQDFSARSSWNNNRASAVFPLRQRPGCNLNIVFLNYWKVKNKIDSVLCTIRLYNTEGQQLAQASQLVEGDHCEISIASIYAEPLDGMAEVEFISTSNLLFAFPAILGIYEAKGNFSVVHSAGRVRNTNEAYKEVETTESNWTCKFHDSFTPFFHIFNGPRKLEKPIEAVLSIFNNGELYQSLTFNTGLVNSFASKIFYLDELIPKVPEFRNAYITLKVPQGQTFSRLVVGNFHRRSEFLEVTHSFPKVEISDFIGEGASSKKKSFLPMIRPKDLDLSLISFPTNVSTMVSADIRVSRHEGERLTANKESIVWKTGGEGAIPFEMDCHKDNVLVCLDLNKGDVPARLNASYRYKVPDSGSGFSTDIATGAKSRDYPPKSTHWGHGVISEQYRTMILIRNIAHDEQESKDDKAQLSFFKKGGETLKKNVQIAAESCAFVDVKEAFGLSGTSEPEFISWILKSEHTHLETFWVSFTKDGRICGEHGF